MPADRKLAKMYFYENLQKLRKSKNLKQQELADALGISLRAYRYYESGQREPQASLLVRMADFFDLSLDELVGRER